MRYQGFQDEVRWFANRGSGSPVSLKGTGDLLLVLLYFYKAFTFPTPDQHSWLILRLLQP